MVELTRIITIEITGIRLINEDGDCIPREQAQKEIEEAIRNMFAPIDDLHVKVQDFLMEKDDE